MTDSTNTIKRAVVTGASSGIGQASVRALVGKGWQVVGLARREGNLRDLAKELGEGFTYQVCDVTDEDSTRKAVDTVLSKVRSRPWSTVRGPPSARMPWLPRTWTIGGACMSSTSWVR